MLLQWFQGAPEGKPIRIYLADPSKNEPPRPITVEGTLVWANFPRRREDGVWTPNLRGTLTTADGSELLVSVHGQSVEEAAPGARRAILARVEVTTEADPYRWLNTCFLVAEGEIDEERENWWLDTYVCVNDQAQGPPALGAEPPARFRQHGQPEAGV